MQTFNRPSRFHQQKDGQFGVKPAVDLPSALIFLLPHLTPLKTQVDSCFKRSTSADNEVVRGLTRGRDLAVWHHLTVPMCWPYCHNSVSLRSPSEGC